MLSQGQQLHYGAVAQRDGQQPRVVQQFYNRGAFFVLGVTIVTVFGVGAGEGWFSPSSEGGLVPVTTAEPSLIPSYEPSYGPSSNPSGYPSWLPSDEPTWNPTYKPSFEPSDQPSHKPTGNPTKKTTKNPTPQPTEPCNGIDVSETHPGQDTITTSNDPDGIDGPELDFSSSRDVDVTVRTTVTDGGEFAKALESGCAQESASTRSCTVAASQSSASFWQNSLTTMITTDYGTYQKTDTILVDDQTCASKSVIVAGALN